jgi:hypothetical protein
MGFNFVAWTGFFSAGHFMGNARSSHSNAEGLSSLTIPFGAYELCCITTSSDTDRSLITNQAKKIKNGKDIRRDKSRNSSNSWPCCREEKLEDQSNLMRRGILAKKIQVSWTENELALLETAVKSVARAEGVNPPRYRELSAAYNYSNGHFLTASHFNFWLRVSHRVKVHNEEECYLKYNELHGTDVARFAAKAPPRAQGL